MKNLFKTLLPIDFSTSSEVMPDSGCPRGAFDNSPAFQRRVGCHVTASPIGTAETGWNSKPYPVSPALFQPSLRDLDILPKQPGVKTQSVQLVNSTSMARMLGYSHFASPRRSERGLTLLEMMVAMALLTIIVLGLTAMFLQTQKAFKSGLKQVDVFEGGRFAISMMTRDFEQMRDAGYTNIYNCCIEQDTHALKLIQIESGFTNIYELQTAYGLIRTNTTWCGIGYYVEPEIPNVWLGTLYRNVATNSGILHDNKIYLNNWTNYNRVAEGVIHFKVRAFDTNGLEVLPYPKLTTPVIFPDTTNSIFAPLPSYLEIELGVLEPETFAQVRSLGNNPVAVNNFLRSRMGKVHIFRQQVPIRTAPLRTAP